MHHWILSGIYDHNTFMYVSCVFLYSLKLLLFNIRSSTWYNAWCARRSPPCGNKMSPDKANIGTEDFPLLSPELSNFIIYLLWWYKWSPKASTRNLLFIWQFKTRRYVSSLLPTWLNYLILHVCYALFTASEMWSLACMLPLIIGDLVPEDNPYWKLFLLLLDILDLVTSPKSTSAVGSYLRQLIQEHHTYFCELCPDRPLTPKLHYYYGPHTKLDSAVSNTCTIWINKCILLECQYHLHVDVDHWLAIGAWGLKPNITISKRLISSRKFHKYC